MSRSKKVLLGALALIVVLFIAGFAFFTLRDEGPDELVLGERATTTTSDAATTTTEPTPTSESSAPVGIEAPGS